MNPTFCLNPQDVMILQHIVSGKAPLGLSKGKGFNSRAHVRSHPRMTHAISVSGLTPLEYMSEQMIDRKNLMELN
jgi:hypothetical protein